MAKIYIASSWKNAEAVRILATGLRENGHQVFDFTSPEMKVPGLPDHFVFHASQWMGKPLKEIDWIEFLDEPVTMKAFRTDKGGLDWADVAVLLVPSGRSSHLEAGYAVGKGMPLFIYGDLSKGEFDVMYHFAVRCYRTNQFKELCAAIEVESLSSPKLSLKEFM